MRKTRRESYELSATRAFPHTGHVGMYIGNGQYVHAPQTGDVVKISEMSGRSKWLTARRIVEEGETATSTAQNANIFFM